MLLPMLTACSGSQQQGASEASAPAPAPAPAEQAVVSSPTPTKSSETVNCSATADVDRLAESIKIIANEDAEILCSYLRASIGGDPPTREFTQLLKAAAILPIGDAHIPDTPVNLGKALVDVAESRGLQNDPGWAVDTFETVFKIAGGTAGDVTPRDINVMLRSSGPMAKTLSDDGLMSMAAVLREQKKESGT